MRIEYTKDKLSVTEKSNNDVKVCVKLEKSGEEEEEEEAIIGRSR